MSDDAEIGRASRPVSMRHARVRALRLLMGVLVFIAVVFAADGAMIGSGVRGSCRRAQAVFPGTRVEALVAMVRCEGCERQDRNHAVWALGQLDDRRALPVLESVAPESLDAETLRIALRHLRHQDHNRSEAFLWRWMLPREQ